MKIIKYPAPPAESAASRYDRDWLHIPDTDTAGNSDDRHSRTLLQQSTERKSRRYVTNGISAVTQGPYIYDPDAGVIITPPDNGGETPEPEDPETPEVPEGTYQTNYTEKY